MAKWWKDNWRLLFLVGILWLIAGIIYFISTPSIEDYSRSVERIIQYTKNIYDDKTQPKHVTNLLTELKNFEAKSYWLGVAKHASLGLFVAGLLILFVEIHTRRQTREEVKEYRDAVAGEVWRAISGRLVPNKISAEIDSILKSNFIREDCWYTITLKNPYDGIDKNFIVVCREISYSPKYLKDEADSSYEMSSVFDTSHTMIVTIDGKTIQLPRHISCKIDDVPIEIDEYINPDNPSEFKHTILLPKPNEKQVHINMVGEEVCTISDQNSYIFGTCTKNLTIRIVNEVKSIEVLKPRVYHPRYKELTRVESTTWQLKVGFFPGQGFGIEWMPKK